MAQRSHIKVKKGDTEAVRHRQASPSETELGRPFVWRHVVPLFKAKGLCTSTEVLCRRASRPPPARACASQVLRSSVREYLCSEAMHHLGSQQSTCMLHVGDGCLNRRCISVTLPCRCLRIQPLLST
eukprot:6188748-Pleurochrysis_carterae.AAC.1